MKITATDTVGALGTVTLGDESTSDIILDPPLLSAKRQTQTEQLAFAPVNFVYGRGNQAISFSWTVERQHASQTAAYTFQLTHANLVPNNCSIEILDDAATEHNFTGAVITEVACLEQTNIRTKFKYSVEGATPDPSHL